jgi:hypothetical protein
VVADGAELPDPPVRLWISGRLPQSASANHQGRAGGQAGIL